MRVTMTDSIKHFTLIFQVKVKRNYLMRRKEWDDATMGKGKLIDEIFAKCEGNYIQPTSFIIQRKCHHKQHRDNPELTERFELMV
jgi:lysyl-tRNA synthetase class 2